MKTQKGFIRLDEMIKKKRPEIENLKSFADDVIQTIWDGYSGIGVDEIQEFAVKHKILEKYDAKKPCCEDCTCEEFGNLPCECYRKTY